MNCTQERFVGGCFTRSHFTSNVGLGKSQSGRYSVRGGCRRESSQSNQLSKKIDEARNERLEKIKLRLNKKINECMIKESNKPTLAKKSGPIIRKKQVVSQKGPFHSNLPSIFQGHEESGELYGVANLPIDEGKKRQVQDLIAAVSVVILALAVKTSAPALSISA